MEKTTPCGGDPFMEKTTPSGGDPCNYPKKTKYSKEKPPFVRCWTDPDSGFSSDSDSDEARAERRMLKEAEPQATPENTLGVRSMWERNLNLGVRAVEHLQDLETFPNNGRDLQGKRFSCGMIALHCTTHGQTIDRAQ